MMVRRFGRMMSGKIYENTYSISESRINILIKKCIIPVDFKLDFVFRNIN